MSSHGMSESGTTTRTADASESAGLVLLADGVGGFHLCGSALKQVIARAGLPLEVRIVTWGHGLGRWHADLTNVGNHISQAARIVEQVMAYRAFRPAAPVFLVGKSGGSGLVVRALELLPEGSVEAVALLAPALSPGYDLSKALRAVRREMVVHHSPMDVLILGVGTRLFGTVDGVKSIAAGLVGFRVPEGLGSADRASYDRLRQVRWVPAMTRCGYLGGHFGPDLPAFLRRYVVPLLIAPADPKAGWHEGCSNPGGSVVPPSSASSMKEP
ncbi:hypothetical protein BH23PLA1_BH23PLA1_04330 [soil metagenome]